MLKNASLGVLFLFGCATGGVASHLVIPPASAGGPAGKWEHFCADLAHHRTDLQTKALQEAGNAGWEFVGALGNSACFKRPM
jgi:hypothetical protein